MDPISSSLSTRSAHKGLSQQTESYRKDSGQKIRDYIMQLSEEDVVCRTRKKYVEDGTRKMR